jgi:hypothetical protein
MASVAFDGGQPERAVGFYTYTVATGRWTWSAPVYALHGYAPREVPATTDLLLRHKHPDDRARAFEVLEDAINTGEPFSCYHRIIDQHQRVRSVVSVGRGIKSPDGRVERVEGYFVDLTEARRDETQAEVEVALARIAEHRGIIDQAKGMIRLATGCNSDEAFDVLRHYSQVTNIKLYDVAQRLMDAADARSLTSDQVLPFLQALANKTRQ